ncbi:GMC family oxidoreductase [Endozoicomonas numazuensis]|uniref:4Fe-4S ferredoxin-type domain-containing protein n=1 Tax=Endozoicomonas numazuensis TaxID=1137799 RepID=A0A081NDJ6_9GAMM|nr:GMC family oxidoreductase [Endozoicomonas numazuensis]KEQ16519.1 hypothetical protein GZ78_21970 [Endozoicomonas numazuensis]
MAETDVIIIGAGVVGAVLATELAKRCSVTVLEAGPDERNFSTPIDNYIKGKTPWPEAPPVQGPSKDYLELSGNYPFKTDYLRRVGGTTLVWSGLAIRMLPEDFKIASLYGKGVDWPIDYDELEKWYCKAEKALGVAGDNNDNLGSFRSANYPFPPLHLPPADHWLKEQLEFREYNGQLFHLTNNPQTHNPEICEGSNSCSPVCPTGAKYTALTHIASAEKAGAKIQAKSVVYNINTDSANNVSSVDYLDWNKQSHNLSAKVVILTAHAIESAKILLLSSSPTNPNGLANSSNIVGHNLMDHSTAHAGGFTPEPVYPFRGPNTSAGVDIFRGGEERTKRAAFRVTSSNHGWLSSKDMQAMLVEGFKSNQNPADVRQECANRFNSQISFSGLVEQLPDINNRVSLGQGRDAMGLPRPAIHYDLGDYERKGQNALLDCQKWMVTASGSTLAHSSTSPDLQNHVAGTCRMGHDPATSVVNSDLRSHDHENLFIVGTSVFPTLGSSNPTLTATALSLRLADFIQQNHLPTLEAEN